jgi:hypothetical protein
MSKRKPPAPLPRHSAKSGKITLRVEPSRKAAAGCVTVAIPFRANHWVLDAAESGCDPLDVAHFDISALGYAAFEAAQDKIMGSTAAIAAHKATKMCCGAQGDHFLISVVCDKTFSSARKNAGSIIAALRFGSLYSRYAEVCKRIGYKPDKDGFNAAATAANSAVKSGLIVVVSGRVNTKAEPVEKGAVTLAKKVRDSPPKSKGKTRSLAAARSVDEKYSYLNAPGLEGVIVHNFVSVKGVKDLHLASGRLYYPNSRARAVGGLKVASKIDPFAKAFGKLGNEAAPLLVFEAASCCMVTPAALKATGDLTTTTVKAAIRKAL